MTPAKGSPVSNSIVKFGFNWTELDRIPSHALFAQMGPRYFTYRRLWPSNADYASHREWLSTPTLRCLAKLFITEDCNGSMNLMLFCKILHTPMVYAISLHNHRQRSYSQSYLFNNFGTQFITETVKCATTYIKERNKYETKQVLNQNSKLLLIFAIPYQYQSKIKSVPMTSKQIFSNIWRKTFPVSISYPFYQLRYFTLIMWYKSDDKWCLSSYVLVRREVK